MIYDGAMTGPVTEAGTPDFTKPREPISFTIDGYTYRAPSIMNPVNLSKIMAKLATVDLDDTAAIMADIPGFMGLIADTMKALIPGPHGVEFAKRLLSDGSADPETGEPAPQIDIFTEALPAINYLMEKLGKGRPEPSSASVNGSTASATDTTTDATSSTDGASPTE